VPVFSFHAAEDFRILPMSLQLPLSLGLKDSASFESYFTGFNNEAVAYLRRSVEQPNTPIIYLWGPRGAGKSHLLQAVCQGAGEQESAAVYLPMQLADTFPCAALEGLENVDRVCIDDIDAVARQDSWEDALMRLFLRIHETGGGLVVSGATIPAELGLDSSQLASRLAGGLVFQLRPLDERGKLQALRLRAARRGFKLPMEVARYLVRHVGQDSQALFDTLETLDRASLAAKRKLTLPFIRSVLNGPSTSGGF
jgi:DnaA family protein